MTFKDYILEAMVKDLTVCQHLYEKIPAGSMDKRPREGMRSTRELLSYLAYIGSGTVETYIHGGWSKEENIARMKTVRDTANMIDPENFVAALDEEKRKITEAFAKLTDEDLLTIETTQPWGTKVKLVEALLKRDCGAVANSRKITNGNPFAASAKLALADGGMYSPGAPGTCLKALASRRDTCIALPQRYIRSYDFEQRQESPWPYPRPDGME